MKQVETGVGIDCLVKIVKGGYSYHNIPVTNPKTRETINRGGFNLHVGLRSDGCIIFESAISEDAR